MVARKILKYVKAVNPANLIFIALFAFFLLYIFVFIDAANMLCIGTPVNKFIQKYTPIASKLVQGPIPSDHPNVISSGTFFNIAGPVEEITTERLRLRSYDGPLPVFQITSETPVFKAVEVGQRPTPAKFSELKPGVTIVVSASYNLEIGEWRVNRLTIDNNLKPRSSR